MWLDAHNHLQDPRLAAQKHVWLQPLERMPIQQAVVNGTSETDWQLVVDLARQHPWILPSLGLHPWHVGCESKKWFESLQNMLLSLPEAAVGEIGLDRWIKPHDFAAQTRVFESQLALAAQLQRPVSIHCLRAWGPLRTILSQAQLPKRGFLLHAYGGPAEMIREFESLGGYFSFPPYFLAPKNSRKRDLFLQISRDRILVETDAPDMLPDPDCNPFPLHTAEGQPLNHPCNLQTAYEGLARILNLSLDELHSQVEKNFARLFGP